MSRAGVCQLCGTQTSRLVIHMGTTAVCAVCYHYLQRAMWDAWDSQAAAPPIAPVDVAAVTARLTEAAGL